MLIIAEKPSVARKIAQFLSNNNFKTVSYKKNVKYHVFYRDNEKFIVVSALGHLFTLSDRKRNWSYPTFEYQWIPAYFEDKITVKKHYIDLIRKFRDERNVIVATDYDIEGELIGYNILRFILNKTDAYRMVFSAITPKDILKAFYNKQPSIDRNFALAGETRHIVDWIYGINLSRALTHAIRHYAKNIILSIGRVQGPTLRIVFEREIEIRNFVPKEYYVMYANVYKEGLILKFKYKKEKFDSKEEAQKIKKSVGGYLTVSNIIKELETYNPPYPYNLTDLQTDAYKLYRITPKQILDITQSLYEKGYISYPRTSSQKLPATIDVRFILSNLKYILSYRPFASILLKKEILKPNNGPKDDVHPAIHPTGIIPKTLSKKEWLIYDLICRRFLATFMDSARVIKVIIETKEGFYFDYKKVKERGWMVIYWLWLKHNFLDLDFYRGERLEIKNISIRKRKTSPPARYNPASLVKRMEELKIGTKATRAEIVQILYKRKYIYGRSIKITELGEKIIEIFDKYLPEILNISLTRSLEEKLEAIEKGKIELKDKVIEETKEIVKNVCAEIKQKEKEIGKELYEVYKRLKI